MIEVGGIGTIEDGGGSRGEIEDGRKQKAGTARGFRVQGLALVAGSRRICGSCFLLSPLP
jgi:hypothetical protein